MVIGIVGRMGSGKTLCGTALATFLSQKFNLPLYSNYPIKSANNLELTGNNIYNVHRGIIVWDEIQATLDSRKWKTNKFTDLIIKTRKKDVCLIWISQHPMQCDVRLRRNTDIIVFAEKYVGRTENKPKFFLTLADYYYKNVIRKVELLNAPYVMKLYNHKDETTIV